MSQDLRRLKLLYRYKYWFFSTYRKFMMGHEKATNILQIWYAGLFRYLDSNYILRLKFAEKRHLDVGCGFGPVLAHYKKLGFESVGVDISVFILYLIKQEFEGFCIAADAEYLPFRQKTFTLITCFELLEHLGKPYTFLRYVYGCLAQGGVFAATTPNPVSPLAKLMKDPFHVNERRPREWQAIIKRIGFAKCDVKTFVIPPLFYRMFGYNSVLFVPRGPSTLIVARK